MPSAGQDLLRFADSRRFKTILADPPWQFTNKTGKVAPEHKRLARYGTMKLDEICALPVPEIAAPTSHLYLWCPNAMLPDGLAVMKAWGFTYKSNIVWHKVRKDGGSGWIQPSLKARSMIFFSICLMVTGGSLIPSTHEASQGAGQMRPVNSGKLLVACNVRTASFQRP